MKSPPSSMTEALGPFAVPRLVAVLVLAVATPGLATGACSSQACVAPCNLQSDCLTSSSSPSFSLSVTLPASSMFGLSAKFVGAASTPFTVAIPNNLCTAFSPNPNTDCVSSCNFDPSTDDPSADDPVLECGFSGQMFYALDNMSPLSFDITCNSPDPSQPCHVYAMISLGAASSA